jgi:hypothetical protein
MKSVNGNFESLQADEVTKKALEYVKWNFAAYGAPLQKSEFMEWFADYVSVKSDADAIIKSLLANGEIKFEACEILGDGYVPNVK